MKKIYIILIVTIFLIAITSCKGNKREITLKSFDDVEVITLKVNEVYTFEKKYYDGYVFAGWKDENGEVVEEIIIKENATFTATFIEIGTTWNINYELNGGTLWEYAPLTYTTGTTLKLENPVGIGNMVFLGWYLDNQYITEIPNDSFGDLKLVAKWDDKNIYHTISYHYDEEVEMPEEYVTKYIEGLEYVLPVPKKYGYFFRGWYQEEEYLTRVRSIDETTSKDLSLYPLWVKKTRTNTYVSFLGDSITTYEGVIPTDFPTYYPAGDVDNIDKTWWKIALDKSLTNLLANNSYSGSYVSQGTMYGASEKRIELLAKDGIDPDAVVIYMGTNDLTHKIQLSKFTKMYEEMIITIKKMYDDVDIYVLTMPSNKYSTDFNAPRKEMNQKIKEISDKYGLFFIDLVDLITFDNVYDHMYAGAHPNALGMEVIGKEVGKVLAREYKRYWFGE